MTTEHDLRVAEQLGSIQSTLSTLVVKLDAHIIDEEKRLKTIEDQLSLARFTFLLLKAMGLTILFLIAFKWGDIKSLWIALK
jgi:hypothetical protein